MENNSQAIELKGIARSLTKLGVQDGQCEDIVNLRFKDGSWRVSDGGKLVHTLPDNYTQLYVHTNAYHHLLGVLNDKLWYFADIDNNGETFTPLDTPVEICDVQGSVTIVQNGHLLTVISTTDSISTSLDREQEIKYAIFVTDTRKYREIKVDPNGKQVDRDLYPFGRLCLNLDCEYSENKEYVVKDNGNGVIILDKDNINYTDSGACVPDGTDNDSQKTLAAKQIWHSQMIEAFAKAKEDNSFTKPMLAICAIKLYDGSYIYASSPIFINPREKYNMYNTACDGDNDKSANNIFFQLQAATIGSELESWKQTEGAPQYQSYKADIKTLCYADGAVYSPSRTPNYMSGICSVKYRNADNSFTSLAYAVQNQLTSVVFGANLCLTLGDLSAILDNNDVFVGLSIFITKEIDVYKSSAEDYKYGSFHIYEGNNTGNGFVDGGGKEGVTVYGNITYKPAVREYNEIVHDLMSSPFYLLREYSINELKSMSNTTTVVELSDAKYKGILNNIIQQERLPNNSFERKSFRPKIAYKYNQRLHIANYEVDQYHGYPIDCFQLSNHSVKPQLGEFAISGTLPNIVDGTDFQYSRTKRYFAETSYAHHSNNDIFEYIKNASEFGTYFAQVTSELTTDKGDIRVIRYIQPYNANSTGFTNGDYANFVEDLSPILSYPDIRATSIDILFVVLKENEVRVHGRKFNLTPHPYLNIAYYVNPELKPISLPIIATKKLTEFNNGDVDIFKPYVSTNITESMPNGIKVSLDNNPFVFPYKNTYQIGNSEIIALMSNAVAVGIGQTGAAPLYVFCKDGIYALLVDSSGEITYTNARIIARDVCNNAKSVTPIDDGVIFTTDRGLMSIAGSEVLEIGQIAEGDVFDITDTSDKAKKIMFHTFTMSQLGALPQDLLDNVDFLTFLKGSIVNYNHNERELMVSNPNYPYTYVMDRNGNWCRQSIKADEYVNNYPTSYRVQHVSDQYGGKSCCLYKVDAESTLLGNQMYLLSQVIKLGTIAFKQAYRLVVRGYFESINASTIGCYVFGSYDGRQWSLLGGNEKSGTFTDIGCKIAHTDVKFLRLCLAGQLSKESRIDFVEVAADGSALNNKLR